MHESFRAYDWEGFMSNRTQYVNVYLDTHIYLSFTNEIISGSEDNALKHSC